MNKKPILLRSLFALLILAVFLFSMFPLGQTDFYKSMKTMFTNPDDPKIEEVIALAKAKQAADKSMYASTAIEEAAREKGVLLTEFVKPRIVSSQNLTNNRDVIAHARKLSAGSIRLGIDLNGGAEFLLELEPNETGADAAKKRKDVEENFERYRDVAIETLRTRLESENIFESEISPAGGNLISLRVPIVSKEEKSRLERLIKMSARLSFALVHPENEKLVQAYLESGFGLMGIPEEQGGVPCDRVTLGLLTEEVAHYCGCLTPFLNNTLAMRDLIDFGSPEQVEMAMNAYMETGKPIFSLGFSEPGAGSDNASMTSVTKKQADGTYILNGQKTWVTQGEVFPYVLVIAKDEDPDPKNREMTMWLVPRELEGVSTAPLHKLGQQIIPFCEMYFDDVVLTEDMRVGETGKGFYNLMKNYEMERCLIIAQTLGCAQAAMDDAAAYVNERITMGKPLAARQLIQEKLTEMETNLQNTRNMLYKTLWKMDNDQSVRIDSALLKRFGARACVEVASEALQIYGGLGYTTETRVGRIWQDLRGNQIAGGTDEIMVYIAGRQLAKQYAK